MRIQILPSGVQDLRNGKRFYEIQEIGVGDYFQDCLISDIDSLILYAGIHRKVFGFYRLLSKRFPYAIDYHLEAERITVYRVLDCRRNPVSIRKSLLDSEP